MTSRAALAVLAWLALVVAGSTGVWAVIRTVGEDVTTATADGQQSSSAPLTSVTPRPSQGPPSTAPATPDGSPGSGTGTPTGESRPWQGAAGSVVTTCRGDSIGFDGAQANSGWRIEVGDRGPREVEVHFARGGDRGEVEVKARCSGGVPSYDVADSGLETEED